MRVCFLRLFSSPRKGERLRFASVRSFCGLFFALALLGSGLGVRAEDAKEHFERGIAFYKSNKTDSALEEFAAANKLAPENPLFLYWIGFLHLQERRYKEALEPLEKAVQLNPNAADAHLNLGNVYDGLERFDDAIREFKKVVTLQPTSADPLYNLGSVYSKLAKKDKRFFTEAIAAYKQAVKLNPKDAYIQDGLGYAQLNSGNFAAAIEAYEKATALLPNTVSFWLNLGLAAQGKATKTLATSGKVAAESDRNKARQALSKAISLSPNNYQIRETYAENLFDSGLDAEAVTQFAKAAELDPKQYPPIYNTGLALARLGRFAEAINAYRKALTLQPDSREVLRGIGSIQIKQGQYEEAIQTFTDLTKLAPEDPHGWINLSACLMKKGDAVGAESALMEALKVAVKGSRAATLRRALATLYYRKGDAESLTRAQEEYTRSLQEAPGNPEALNGLGLLAQKQKLYEEAIGYYKKAITQNPRYADALNNLGVAYENKGDSETAIGYYRKALLADPKHALAKKNLSRFPAASDTTPPKH